MDLRDWHVMYPLFHTVHVGLQLQVLFAEAGTIYASASCSLQSPCSQSPITDCQMPGWAICCCCFSWPLTSLLCLWSCTSVCLWTNSLSNLFSVMTLQLIMQQLPVNLAIICLLYLSCPHPWANCILLNIKNGITALFLHIVFYAAQSTFKYIIIFLVWASQMCNVNREW